MFCHGITLYYLDEQDHKHLLIMNQINISGVDAGNTCYNRDPVRIHISISSITNLIITLNNSLFHGLRHTAIRVRNQCHGNNTIIIENCTFERNTHKYNGEYFLATLRPLIDIALSHTYKSVIFEQCSFMKNYNNCYLISIVLSSSKVCYGRIKDCIGLPTNITFVRCQFTNNFSELMNIKARQCTVNLFIIGPSTVVYTMKRHMSQKVYNINLNKTCAVYIQQAHCSLVVYNYDHKLRYFINYMVVYKVTW